MEDVAATEVVPDEKRRRFKHHSCLAYAHFNHDQREVREAIAAASQALAGFSPALSAHDKHADIEVAFHTPAGWLDVLSFYLRPVAGKDGAPESTAIICFSFSTNFCPDRAPWSWCRCCCGWMRLFSDGGQNRKHITTFFDDLEARLKESSFLEIVSSS